MKKVKSVIRICSDHRCNKRFRCKANSKRSYCSKCANSRMIRSQIQLQNKSGKFYNTWKANMIASLSSDNT